MGLDHAEHCDSCVRSFDQQDVSDDSTKLAVDMCGARIVLLGKN